jgi:hypothetical protein
MNDINIGREGLELKDEKKSLIDYVYTKAGWAICSLIVFIYLIDKQQPVSSIETFYILFFSFFITIVFAFILIPLGGLIFAIIEGVREEPGILLPLGLFFGPMLVLPFFQNDWIHALGFFYYLILMFTWMKMEAGWFAIIFTVASMGVSIYLAGVINF